MLLVWTQPAYYPVPMRLFRIITVLLTLLTLPGYGLAGLSQRSCQEEMRSSTHVTLAGDCCPGKSDPGTSCKRLGDSPLSKKDTCSACKAGYNCKSPQPCEPGAVLTWLAPQVHFNISRTPADRLPSLSPDGLWRPPRLI